MGPDQYRRAILAVVCFIVLFAYFRVKIPLIAGRFLFLNGILSGLLLGLFIADRDDSLAAAGTVSVISPVALYVVFLLDDFRLASVFGVVPPLVRLDPGTFLLRLILFGFVELVIVIALGFAIAVTTLPGAWIGSTLRSILDDEFG